MQLSQVVFGFAFATVVRANCANNDLGRCLAKSAAVAGPYCSWLLGPGFVNAAQMHTVTIKT
jgi:hypothetical protein